MSKLNAILGLLCTALVAGCGSSGIRIENIHNLQQLDSVIARLPKSQVKVDSLPVRILNIRIQGDFNYYGAPVKTLYAEAKNELLTLIHFETEKGAADILKTLESTNGIGWKEYSQNNLSWKTDDQNIIFNAATSGSNLLNLGNKEKVFMNIAFNPPGNSITALSKQQTSTANADNYRLELSTGESGCRVYVNGFLALVNNRANVSGLSTDINQYLVKGAKQHIKVELIPGNDFDGKPRARLHKEAEARISVEKWSEQSCMRKKIFQFRTPVTDTLERLSPHSSRAIHLSAYAGQSSAIIEKDIEIPPVADELPCYSEATDLSNVTDLEAKVKAHYRRLLDAYQQHDTKQLEALLYPMEQNYFRAYHLFKPGDGAAEWMSILGLAANGVEFKMEDNSALYITPDKRFARLVTNGNNAMSVLHTEKADSMTPLDYYILIDKNGQIKFALN